MESEATVSPILAMLAVTLPFAIAFFILACEWPAAERLRLFVSDHTQKMMLLVAGVATSASLYYSEYVGFTPCEFCWFQRIAMYPLAVILLIAGISRSRIEPRYIVPLALIGLGFSIYHYQLQLFPDQSPICSGPVSCTGKYVEEFDFVTIPFMAGCGFLGILLLQLAEWRVELLFRREGTPPATR